MDWQTGESYIQMKKLLLLLLRSCHDFIVDIKMIPGF